MAESETKSVRLSSFDGTHEGFQIWWMRFRAYSRVHKFAQALTPGDGDPDLPDTEDEELDQDTAMAALQTTAKRRNDIAMAQFCLAFTTDSDLVYIYEATTDEWPGGKASIVVNALYKKYSPKDTASLVELQWELNRVSMKNNDAPSVLFGTLARIRNKYNSAQHQVSPEQLMAAAIKAAPKDYKAVVTAEQRLLGTAVTNQRCINTGGQVRTTNRQRTMTMKSCRSLRSKASALIVERRATSLQNAKNAEDQASRPVIKEASLLGSVTLVAKQDIWPRRAGRTMITLISDPTIGALTRERHRKCLPLPLPWHPAKEWSCYLAQLTE